VIFNDQAVLGNDSFGLLFPFYIAEDCKDVTCKKGSLFQHSIVLRMVCKQALLGLNMENSLQRVLILKIQ